MSSANHETANEMRQELRKYMQSGEVLPPVEWFARWLDCAVSPQPSLALTPMARRDDPVSSHVAASRLEESGKLEAAREEALALVRRHPHRTSRELADLAVPDRSGWTPLELEALRMRTHDRIRRRLSELRTLDLVERFDHEGGARWIANPNPPNQKS